MVQRLLTKRNLISFGLFTLFFHVVNSLLPWFITIQWLDILDYVLLGLMGFASVLFLAKQRNPIRYQPAQVLLLLFMAWFIISCLSMSIRYNNDWVTYNNFSLLNTAISIFLVFPLGYVMIREGKQSVGIALLHILLLGWTVFITIILIPIFQGKELVTPSNGLIRLYEGGLSLNCNRNTTGSWEMLFFLGCCFMTVWCKKIPLKVVYGISSVIHYVALTISNCRAGFLAALVGFAALAGIAAYLWLEKKNKQHRLLISVAVALIAGVGYFYLSGPVLNLYNACASGSGASIDNRATITQEQTFSGREEVWRYAVEGIFSSFRCAVFGVTPQSTSEMISQVSNGVKNVYTHNQFLEIAAGIGIPGLCIFLVWLFTIMKSSYKLFFVEKNRTLLLIAPAIIISLLLANMMEAYLVFYEHISGFVFFLLCGMVYGKANEPVKARQLTRQEIRNRERKKKK